MSKGHGRMTEAVQAAQQSIAEIKRGARRGWGKGVREINHDPS